MYKNSLSHRFFRVIRYNILQRNFYGITSPIRILPDFIVIGAKRCGTTSLYQYLGLHPCIKRSSRDHLGFFDDNYHLGMQFYRSFFPTIFEKKTNLKKNGKFLTYDVTSSYIQNPENAQRIFDKLPNIKIIAILRNPVDRAYSEYNSHLQADNKMKAFEYYVDKEIIEIEKQKDDFMDESKLFSKDKKNYLRKGFYFEQLTSWYNLFPKKNIHIISTEQLGTKSDETMKGIFRFLNLDPYQIDTKKRYEKGTYPDMKESTRSTLQNLFRDKNKKLYGLIQKDFAWD